mgnify:CR=1 FL=1
MTIRRSQLSRFNDPNGCFSDWLQEQIDQLRYESHMVGICKGIPECIWCIEEEERLDR